MGVASPDAHIAVIVADDNDALRYLTVHALASLRGRFDFDVDEARDGAEALAHLERRIREGHRALVLSDHRMPNLTGLELATKAREAMPRDRIRMTVMTSGEPLPAIAQQFRALDVSVVERPFGLHALKDLLSEELGKVSPR